MSIIDIIRLISEIYAIYSLNNQYFSPKFGKCTDKNLIFVSSNMHIGLYSVENVQFVHSNNIE